MIVRVTHRCIANWVKNDADNCPISKALVGAGLYEPNVDIDTIEFYDDGILVSVRTPRKAVSFIKRFDSGKPVKPFAFRMPR